MEISLKKLFGWFPELRGLLLSSSDEDFDLFFEEHLAQCVQRMEGEAHHLSPDSEEKLSAFLGAALSLPGLSVIREGYSNGRVDLTIRREGLLGSTRLAEAKIYSGPAYHVSAIEQLVLRYSTGRQRTGYVVEYVKKAGIAKLVTGLREHADKTFPVEQQGVTKQLLMKWTYESMHMHSSAELLRVVHVGVNLYRA